MSNKLPILSLVSVAVAVVALVLALEKPVSVGSLTGPDVWGYFNVHGVFSDGGNYSTISTTSATYTLTSAEMDDESVIVVASMANAAALTLTLPATSSLPLPAEAGAQRTWKIENAHTGAATTTTIAAGAGIDLQKPESTGADVILDINGYGWLTCFRERSTDVVCRLDETVVAD